MANGTFFISYSRQDVEIVQRVAEGLAARGIRTWLDTMLLPGEPWQQAIAQALRNAAGMIVFVSHASLASDWVLYELEAAARGEANWIIPVLLEEVPRLPAAIARRAWIDASHQRGEAQVAAIIDGLADVLRAYATGAPGMAGMDAEDIRVIADMAAAQARGEAIPPQAIQKPPDSVFIVHGHDLALRDEVEAYLTSLGITPIVLSKQASAHQSLLQKFLTWSRDVRFAVILISADDRGASRRQYDPPRGVGERALQFRARQNVILELGFFYGYLGWEHVFVLLRPSDEVFPNFEIPSDLAGVPFDVLDEEGEWKLVLRGRLRQAGFQIP